MKLKKFKVRYCISPERAEREEIVICNDEQSAKNIIKHSAAESSIASRYASIHEVVEVSS